MRRILAFFIYNNFININKVLCYVLIIKYTPFLIIAGVIEFSINIFIGLVLYFFAIESMLSFSCAI